MELSEWPCASCALSIRHGFFYLDEATLCERATLGGSLPTLYRCLKRSIKHTGYCTVYSVLLLAACTVSHSLMTLTLFTADDYKSKVLSVRGGAGQRVGYTKTIQK